MKEWWMSFLFTLAAWLVLLGIAIAVDGGL